MTPENSNNDAKFFSSFEILSTYSRTQAIEDGVLIEVDPKVSQEAGFHTPVAVTSAVWDKFIQWEDEDTKRQTVQDLDGRLWDILYMLRVAINKQPSNTNQIIYSLYVVPRGGQAKKPHPIKLKALIHGGDQGEPVITIMLPNED